ncbi:MAG: thioredoxin domain-containing protein, partial [Cyanobacteria bacterium J06636_16]
RALTQDGLESVAAAAPTPSADGGTKAERVNIAIGKAPTRGPKRAPVTIVVFSDFQCPYCSRAQKTLDTLAKSYKGKIRFVFKHNPLPFHEQAKPAALAALAAHSQGKFWEYHDLLFNNQRALSTSDLERYARQVGLDLKRFRKDMHSDRIRAVLDNDRQQASKVGARGTPTFFINGRILTGAQAVEKFKEMIDQELAQPRKGRKR